MSVPKIVGIEQEYAIAQSGRPDFDPVELSFLVVNAYEKATQAIWDYDTESPLLDARGFKREGEEAVISKRANYRINNLLINGARFYVDHAHPEYSTAECRRARDVVAFDKGGEQILRVSAERASRDLEPGTHLCLYKNNTDHKGNSYGTHENYLMDAAAYRRLFPKYPQYPDQLMKVLVPFLVSRQLICGAGKVGHENGSEACDYQISQRADFFETVIGGQTTHTRPIVNTRDEPHADRNRYSRLHVIIGDANLSEVSAFLKVGLTQLVLTLIEEQALDFDLSLDDPVRTLIDISHDPFQRRRHRLARGIQVSAVELQRRYLEVAQQRFGGSDDPDCQDLLRRWARVLDALERDPMELDREIDWVIKLRLLERARSRRELSWQDARLRKLDIEYHDIDLRRGLYYRLEAEGRVEKLLEDEEIKRFVQRPPEDTRAYFRSECLRRYRDAITHANWDVLTFDCGEQHERKVPLADPLRGTREMVQELLEQSDDAKSLLERLAGG